MPLTPHLSVRALHERLGHLMAIRADAADMPVASGRPARYNLPRVGSRPWGQG